MFKEGLTGTAGLPAYLFAKSLYMRNYRNVLLVLAFLVFYFGVEAAFEAVGAAAGVSTRRCSCSAYPCGTQRTV